MDIFIAICCLIILIFRTETLRGDFKFFEKYKFEWMKFDHGLDYKRLEASIDAIEDTEFEKRIEKLEIQMEILLKTNSILNNQTK